MKKDVLLILGFVVIIIVVLYYDNVFLGPVKTELNKKDYEFLTNIENQVIGFNDVISANSLIIKGSFPDVQRFLVEINGKMKEIQDFTMQEENHISGEKITRVVFRDPWWMLAEEAEQQNVNIWLQDNGGQYWKGSFAYKFDDSSFYKKNEDVNQEILQEIKRFSKISHEFNMGDVYSEVSLSPESAWTFKPQRYHIVIPVFNNPPTGFDNQQWLNNELSFFATTTSEIGISNGIPTILHGRILTNLYKTALSKTQWDEKVNLYNDLFLPAKSEIYSTYEYGRGHSLFSFINIHYRSSGLPPFLLSGSSIHENNLIKSGGAAGLGRIIEEIRNSELGDVEDKEEVLMILLVKEIRHGRGPGRCMQGFVNTDSGYIILSTDFRCYDGVDHMKETLLHEWGHIAMLSHPNDYLNINNKNIMSYGRIGRDELEYHQAVHSLARMFGENGARMQFHINKMTTGQFTCGDGFISHGEECDTSTIYGRGDYVPIESWRLAMPGYNSEMPPIDGYYLEREPGFETCIDNAKETSVNERIWPIGRQEDADPFPYCNALCLCEDSSGRTTPPPMITWNSENIFRPAVDPIPPPRNPANPVTPDKGFCGDGIIQIFFENCEPPNSKRACTLPDGTEGEKICNNKCILGDCMPKVQPTPFCGCNYEFRGFPGAYLIEDCEGTTRQMCIEDTCTIEDETAIQHVLSCEWLD